MNASNSLASERLGGSANARGGMLSSYFTPPSLPMKVLVTGAAGLLGGRVAALLAPRFEVVAARHVAAPPPGPDEIELDLLDRASIAAALERARPDAVVNCAAQSNPDTCERDPERATRLNTEATAEL